MGNFKLSNFSDMMNLNKIIRKYGVEILLNLFIAALIFLLLYLLL
jgi:hypothetical protein